MMKRESFTTSESLQIKIRAYKTRNPGKFSSFVNEVLDKALTEYLETQNPQTEIDFINQMKEECIRDHEAEMKRLEEDLSHLTEYKETFQSYLNLKEEALQTLSKIGNNRPEWFADNGWEMYCIWVQTDYAQRLLRDAQLSHTDAYKILFESVRTHTEQKNVGSSRIRLRRICASITTLEEFEKWAEDHKEILDDCYFSSAAQAYKFVSAGWDNA